VIGILDWGIGGLGCYRALRELDPALRVVYFSDAGFTPYGKVPARALATRVLEVAAELRARGVRELAIACNAASSVLPELGVTGARGVLQTEAGELHVSGIVAHGVALARAARVRKLGVVGGARAIRSNVYGAPLRAAGLEVVQRVAQPLSARVEAGDLASQALRRELAQIVTPLRGVEALLLACTHYPALAPRFVEALPGVRLLDPAPRLARHVLRLARGAASARSPRRDVFLTSGDVRRMRSSALRAFGVALGDIERC
jgi:glutamate racemase